jgi:Arm domain-containing DNA-binding protein
MTKTRQRKQNLLTARSIQTAKEPGRYSDGNGLYLVVRLGGSKQWVFLYRRDGKLKEMGLSRDSRFGQRNGHALLVEVVDGVVDGLVEV